MASEALLVDLGENDKIKTNVKKRNSFYSLPKTLSEDDDPFGLFQSSRELKPSAQLEPIPAAQADPGT